MTTQTPDVGITDVTSRHRGTDPGRPITVGIDHDTSRIVLILDTDYAEQLARLAARHAPEDDGLVPYAELAGRVRTWDATTVDLLTGIAALRDASGGNCS